MPLDSDASNVKKTLDILRETPADTSAASDKVLETIYLYLLKVPASSDGLVHWFCKKADATTIDAATFLIRLMAYNSPQVTEWKKRLHSCLNSCAFCAQGFEMAKVTSQNTFLAAFSQDILAQFFIEFDKWEAKEVLEDIQKDSTTGELQCRNAPTGMLYRMVSNWAIFRDPQVVQYLQRHIPSNLTDDWPDEPIPAALLVLLLAADPGMRSWAVSCASRCKMIQSTFFTGSYNKAMQLVVQVLKIASTSLFSESCTSPAEFQSVTNHIQFSRSTELWSGCHRILRLIPPEWFKSSRGEPLELKRIILSQLRKTDPSFIEVFRCFLLLMKRLSKEVWTGEGSEYPLGIFEAIDHNPVYMEHLCSPSPESGISNFSWIQEFLSTIREYDYYGKVLDGVLNHLFEDTGNEQVVKIRPSLASFTTRTINKELQRCRVDNKSDHVTLLLRTVEIHFGELLSFAYDQSQTDQGWEAARTSAHNFIEDFLSPDIWCLKTSISALCRILAQKKRNAKCDPLPAFSFRENAWKAFSSNTRTPAGIANFVLLVSKVAHLDPLRSDVFANNWNFPAGDNAIKEINHAISILQNGLSNLISSFADYNVSDGAIDILQRPGVGKAVTLLLLSPVQDYHTTAKTLVGLAFDVDGRMECFRSLLENLPNETLDGMLEFLSIFHQHAATMPEASNISAALVRCFADILDVLCASPDGLLLNSHFLRPKEPTGPSSLMPRFWKMLTKSLCIIYSRASMWAQYNDVTDMVLWMRDALILARDVLKQWRVIEKASNASIKGTSKPLKPEETSPIGRQMIESLQDFLPELIKWLRLTDEELLHQSFSLLQGLFDLMRETHVRPSEQALEKLSKHVEGALKTDTKAREQRTRLDQGRLLQLSEALSYLNKKDTKERDREVPIVSPTTTAKEPALQIPAAKSEAKTRNYIQGRTSSSKTAHRAPQSLQFIHDDRPSGSKFFSEADQKKLDSSISMPSFRKTSGDLPSGPSKIVADHRRPLTKKPEPKNEALSRPVQSSDESSSSSSDSDDVGLGADAFRKSPKPKSPKKMRTVERRQIKTLDIPISDPTRDRLMRNRQAHLTAMRMRPDVSDLHRTILSWDYNHVGPTPPGEPLKLVSVPARFENYHHYFGVFRPLLVMECWAQLQQSKEEKQDSYQCKVDSRQFVDDWLDIDITISESVKKDWYLAETDVIVFKHPAHDKCLMGKVKYYRALPSGIVAVVRCYIQSGIGDPGLQISTLWQISKVLSLSTLHREYGALVSLQYNDICGFILQPSLPIAAAVNGRDVEETMQKYRLNEPQAAAILKALKTQGFLLIQGPPGTGKTSTICSLIAKFLSERPRAAVPIVVGRIPPTNASRNTGGQPGGPTGPTARILVCAPSNAAIDEVAQRIKDGYVGSEKKSTQLNIVRVGADQAISPSVRDISLDYLVDQKLDGSPKPFSDIGNEIRAIQQELESVKRDRIVKVAELTSLVESTSRKTTLENEVKVLNSRRQSLINKLDSKKDKQKSDSRTLDTLRRNTRREIITQADVICSTLSGAGHDILENLDFDLIIIDEAAQAIEMSSLIPLKYFSSRCVMVGDPQQLPPTVISQEASRFGYNQSLFVRLQQSQKDAIHLLSIQYRMHPDISRLPSQVFYGGKLLNGPNMEEKTKQPWHTHAKFGTYKFLNVSWGIEESNGHSIKNSAECNVAIELYRRLSQDFGSMDFTLRIGVVSMYKAQINALRRNFIERFGNDVLSKIDFNTVDGFQGQEKDIIILSCVRAGPGLQTVGFLSDIRRMNVALTRAKSSLFVLGNTATLERSDETWRKIVQDARDRSALVNIDKSYFSGGLQPQSIGPKSSKGSRKPPLQPSLPGDLSTPKDLKASMEQKLQPARPFTPQDARSTLSASSSSKSEPSRGTKRPLDDDKTNPSIPSSLEPPHKRPVTEASLSHPASLAESSKWQPPTASTSSQSGSTHAMKRPLDTDETRNSNSNPPRPPPPRKKPKQPQTMFIPKKRT